MRLVSFIVFAAALAAQTVNYTYDSAGRLTGVAYPNGKVISYSYDAAGNLRLRVVTVSVAGAVPVASAAGVTNAASFLGGGVSPGELVTLYGTGIGPDTLASYKITPEGLFDSFVGDTTVFFDGIPAPLIYASGGQTTAIVPYSIAGKTSTQMVIRYQGRSSASVSVPVVPAAPGLFSADSSGKGNGAILNQDNTVNSPSNPAAKGSIVVLYGTGEGQTTPGGVDGLPASTIFPKPSLPLSVTIGGVAANVLYYGAAPTLVAGVFQVNVVVPASVASGAAPVVVTVGTASSQPGLTVAVQ